MDPQPTWTCTQGKNHPIENPAPCYDCMVQALRADVDELRRQARRRSLLDRAADLLSRAADGMQRLAQHLRSDHP